MKRKMTGKQEIFCLEYIKDFNAKRSAIKAGYSKKTAHVIGNENLNKPYIRARISALVEKRAKKIEIDSDWVLRELKNLFDVSIDDFVTIDELTGELEIDLKESTKEQRSALETIQTDVSGSGMMKTTRVKIGLNNKLRILEAIGKHVDVGAFKDKVELTGKDEGPIEITDPRQILRDRIAGISERIRSKQDTE